MNNIKRKWYLITSGLLIVLMGIYSFYFNVFYADSILFGEFETSNVIKLLLIIKYRGQELSIFLLFFFCLITLYFFNFIYYYFSIKIEGDIDKAEKIKIVVFLMVLFAFIISVSINVVGFIFIPLLLLSGTLAYIAYLIAKQTVGTKIILNEEVIGNHGPFETADELLEYITYLEVNNNLQDVVRKEYQSEGKYFVEFYMKNNY